MASRGERDGEDIQKGLPKTSRRTEKEPARDSVLRGKRVPKERFPFSSTGRHNHERVRGPPGADH